MINWPAIIKQADDVELIYIRDQREWNADNDLHNVEYDESDFLIDALGNIFVLTQRDNNIVIPHSNSNVMSLINVLGLIKAHAGQKGSCCVAKLYAPSIIEAFKIVESMEDT